jgi:hypothetical protein
MVEGQQQYAQKRTQLGATTKQQANEGTADWEQLAYVTVVC